MSPGAPRGGGQGGRGAGSGSGRGGFKLFPGNPLSRAEVRRLVDWFHRKFHEEVTAYLLDEKVFDIIPPHKRLTVNVHLDGLQETHDYVCAKDGVFVKAMEMIRESKRRGYHTTTNTTVFKETNVDEVEELLSQLAEIPVDGMLISPGYQY